MTEKYRVYIAGPISRGDLYHNICQAEEAFTKLVKAGFAPFCPHWSVYGGGAEALVDRVTGETRVSSEALAASSLPLTHSEWLGIDLPWVSVSHMVLRLPGESPGADQETALARQLNIPVYDKVETLIRDFGNSS